MLPGHADLMNNITGDDSLRADIAVELSQAYTMAACVMQVACSMSVSVLRPTSTVVHAVKEKGGEMMYIDSIVVL